jgi:hypothetical protein
VSVVVAAFVVLAVRAVPHWRGVGDFAPSAIRYGGPTAFSSASVALHRRADVLLLSALGRTAEIGAYSLAQAIAETFWLITDSLENALFVGRHAQREGARPFRSATGHFASTSGWGWQACRRDRRRATADPDLLSPISRRAPTALAHRRHRGVGESPVRSIPTCLSQALVGSALLCATPWA